MIKKIGLIFSMLFLISFISGAGADWSQFGNSYQPLTQAQFENYYSYFNTSVILDETISNGQDQYDYPTQPLIDELGILDTNYMFVVDGNFLKVYDNDFDFVTEVYLTNTSIGQLGIVDWDNDGSFGEIAGFFRDTSTNINFKVYRYNLSLNILNEIYSFNFTYPSTNGVTGVRCAGDTCYGVLYDDNGSGYLLSSIEISQGGYEVHQLFSTRQENNYNSIEPVGIVDYDNNGKMDFLIFSEENVSVYNEDGVVIRTWSFNNLVSGTEFVRGAKFVNSDASPYYKVAIVTDGTLNVACGSGVASCSKVYLKNIIDGSESFNALIDTTGNSGDNVRVQGLAIGDYNDDGYDDIWSVAGATGTNQDLYLKIYKGDSSVLFSSASFGTGGASYPNSQITLARMDSDDTFDVIHYPTGKIFSPALNGLTAQLSLSGISGQGSCIPSDLNYDGYLDVVCVDGNSAQLFTANITNGNSYINSFTFNPSASIVLGETLEVIVSATDPESDSILYGFKCSNSDSWSLETGSNTYFCNYESIGSYNVSARVRDSYHIGEYDVFSYIINVTEEPEEPEEPELPDEIQTEGGLAIPRQLVDVEDINQGLLPEIYYGTIAFFSNTLQPVIVVVFIIFSVLIIITIGMIVKKIAYKVSDM